MQSKETILTIGVAIYNVQKYLPRCLDSLTKQKGDDIEILLIDDGSTDKSGKICDKYAAQDTRIKVIHQNNAGRGLVRNSIIANAKGKWITFVDGDDTLTPNAIDIFRKYFDSEQDVLIFLEENDCKGIDIASIKQQLVTDIQYYQSNIHDGLPPYHLMTPWGKLFKVDFLHRNNLRFRDIKKSQDFIFSIEYLFYLKSILLIPEIIYKYQINENSVSIKYNPNIVHTINILMETLEEIVAPHRDLTNVDINKMYYREGLIQIKNLLDLVAYNVKCHWGKNKRLRYLQHIFGYQWVKDCIKHEEYLMDYTSNLKTFCKFGKIGDIKSIDKYYINLRNKRQYFILNKTLRKIKGVSLVFNLLKSIKCK